LCLLTPRNTLLKTIAISQQPEANSQQQVTKSQTQSYFTKNHKEFTSFTKKILYHQEKLKTIAKSQQQVSLKNITVY